MNEQERLELEAAAFRQLVQHLRSRPDVQNIDLMNLAGFCRNCLSKWYKAAADDLGVEVTPTRPAKRSTACPMQTGRPSTRKKPAPSSKRPSTKRTKNDPDRFPRPPAQRQHAFADTLAFIAAGYDYQPTAFANGKVENAAGQNEGSCKTLGLALLEGLGLEEALLAFGEHYRAVLATPQGSDHGNIRALMETGLAGVRFDGEPLKRKA